MRRRFLSILSFTFLFTTFSAQACGQSAAEFRDRPDIPKEWPREPVRAAHGMAATAEPLASQAGARKLKPSGKGAHAGDAPAFSPCVPAPAAANSGGPRVIN